MALTAQTYSLSALEIELGVDRRTLGKRLRGVAPAEGSGRSKRWRLRDVLAVLERDPVAGQRSSRAPRLSKVEVLDGMALGMEQIIPWQHEDIVPLPEYAARLEIPHDPDLVALVAYGLPLLPPLSGEEGARVSIPHADRWMVLFAGMVQALGGNGLRNELAEEAARIRGIEWPPGNGG